MKAKQLFSKISIGMKAFLLRFDPRIRIVRKRIRGGTLYCMAIITSGVSQTTRRSYVEVSGIRIFRESAHFSVKDFLERFVRRGGIKKLQQRLGRLRNSLGDDLFEMLKRNDLGVKFMRKNVDLIDESGFIVFRGSEDDVRRYLQWRNATPEARIADFRGVHVKMNQNDVIKYNRAGTKQEFRVPESRPPAAGTAPDFAGSPHLYPGGKSVVKISLTGSRSVDFIQAFRKMGLEWKDVTPGGGRDKIKAILKDYTWHHVDDVDPLTLSGSMQLISKEAHNATISHFGGCHQVKALLGLSKYR